MVFAAPLRSEESLLFLRLRRRRSRTRTIFEPENRVLKSNMDSERIFIHTLYVK